MLTVEKKRLIQESLRCLGASHSAAVMQIEETIAVLTNALELGGIAADHAARSTSEQDFLRSPDHDLPIADQTTFTVVWRGRSCFLGNTLLFRLFARLLRSRNRFVSHVDLLDDVWDGPREGSVIRGVAKRLRDQLAKDGMADLAQAIDGTTSGHYGLMLV